MYNFRSILLVDDDPTQIAILNAYFRSMRTETVRYASDGEQACKLVHEDDGELDLIVTDLNMPQLDGIAFLRHLRDEGYHGKVAVVSGLDQKLLENAEILGREHGLQIIGTVRKPLTKAKLDAVFLHSEAPCGYTSPAQKQEISRDDILAGLARNEFIPFYQPKLDLLTGAIIGAEVLARWECSDGVIINPDRFISIAERQGLISSITCRLLERVVNDIRERPHWDGLKFSINISPCMLNEPDLPDRIREIPANAGLPSAVFCLEITESGVVGSDNYTLEVLTRLRVHGFELSVDDFGTGASNIANLRQFPYSELKIDQSFIRNMITDPFCAETVNASITLARELNMRIVAEGVESREILDLAKSKGIDQAQGYFISLPKSAREIDDLLTSRHYRAENGTYETDPQSASRTG